MNWQTFTLSFSALAVGAASVLTAPAQAATFSAAECTGDNYNCTFSGDSFFSLSASDGAGDAQLTRKFFEGYEGIGVATQGTSDIEDDPSWGEIDFDETLSVDFAEATILESLDLGFLYQPGVNHDRVFEKAKISAKLTDGSILENILSITGDNTASLSGLGTVNNLSPSTPGGAGLYSILNPFGNFEIAGFSLTAIDSGENFSRQSWDSDFVLVSAKTASVPEPSIILGLLGVGAVGAWSRQRQRS